MESSPLFEQLDQLVEELEESADCCHPHQHQDPAETSYDVFQKRESIVFTPTMSVADTERTAILSQSFASTSTSTIADGMLTDYAACTTPPRRNHNDSSNNNSNHRKSLSENLNCVHRKWEALAETWKTTVAVRGPHSPERPPLDGILPLSPLSHRPNMSPSNHDNHNVMTATMTPPSNSGGGGARSRATPQLLFHGDGDGDGSVNPTANASSSTTMSPSERPLRPYGFEEEYTPPGGSPSRGARISRLETYTNMSVFERLYGQANIPPPSSPMMLSSSSQMSHFQHPQQQQQKEAPTKGYNEPTTPQPLLQESKSRPFVLVGSNSQQQQPPARHQRPKIPTLSSTTTETKTSIHNNKGPQHTSTIANHNKNSTKKPWIPPSRHTRSFSPEDKKLRPLLIARGAAGTPTKAKTRPRSSSPQPRHKNNNPKGPWKSPSRVPEKEGGPLTMIQLRMARTQIIKDLTAQGLQYTSESKQRSTSTSPLTRRNNINHHNHTCNRQQHQQNQNNNSNSAAPKQHTNKQSLMALNWCTPPRQRLQHPLQSASARQDLAPLTSPSLPAAAVFKNRSKPISFFDLPSLHYSPTRKDSSLQQQGQKHPQIKGAAAAATTPSPSMNPKRAPVERKCGAAGNEFQGDHATPIHGNTTSTNEKEPVCSPLTAAGAKGLVQSAYRQYHHSHHSVEQKQEMIALFRQEKQKVEQANLLRRTNNGSSLRAKWKARQPMHRRNEAAKRLQHWYHHRITKYLRAKRTQAALCIQTKWRFYQKCYKEHLAERRAAEVLQLCWWRTLSKTETDRIATATTKQQRQEHVYSHIPQQVQDFVRNSYEKRALEAKGAKLLQLCWWRDLSSEEEERVSKLASNSNNKFDKIPKQVRDFVVSSRERSATEARAARILQQWWYRRRHRCIRVKISLKGSKPGQTSSTSNNNDNSTHGASPLLPPQQHQRQQLSDEDTAPPLCAPTPVQLATESHNANAQKNQKVGQSTHNIAACIKLQSWSRMVLCRQVYATVKPQQMQDTSKQDNPESKTRSSAESVVPEGEKENLQKGQANGSTTPHTVTASKPPSRQQIKHTVGKKKEALEKQKWNARNAGTEFNKQASPASWENRANELTVDATNGVDTSGIDLNAIYRRAFLHWRGQLLEERKLRVRAVTKIQAIYRQHRFRTVYCQFQCSAIRIQRCYRSGTKSHDGSAPLPGVAVVAQSTTAKGGASMSARMVNFVRAFLVMLACTGGLALLALLVALQWKGVLVSVKKNHH